MKHINKSVLTMAAASALMISLNGIAQAEQVRGAMNNKIVANAGKHSTFFRCALPYVQASAAPGKTLGSGGIFTASTQVAVNTALSMIDNKYVGAVYLSGSVNGKKATVSTPVYDPVFTTDGIMNSCVATSNFMYNGIPAYLTFTWTQDARTFQTGTVAWTVKDANGVMLFASNGNGSPVAIGQVIVRMPILDTLPAS